jgi:guanylate kinase
LELAVERGINAASEEYFFLSEEKFKDEQSRDSFLIMKTHEARRSWIARAFEQCHKN